MTDEMELGRRDAGFLADHEVLHTAWVAEAANRFEEDPVLLERAARDARATVDGFLTRPERLGLLDPGPLAALVNLQRLRDQLEQRGPTLSGAVRERIADRMQVHPGGAHLLTQLT